LCEEKRGTQTGLTYAGEKRVIIRYDLPLTEMVFGFYDRLKSASRGYASLDYEPKDYKPADLVRMDLLVNGERVDALSLIVHRESAYNKGRDLCVKMKELIPSSSSRSRSSVDRFARHRAHDGEGAAQERHGQVLRRRHHAQAQVAGASEGR